MKKLIYTIICIVSSSSCLAQENKAIYEVPTVLEIDMARKQDYPKINVFFDSLKTCQANELQIHYAFSHVKFSQISDTCNVVIEVTGELSETATSNKFICKMNALQKIDWLQSDVPLVDLKNSRGCQHIGAR